MAEGDLISAARRPATVSSLAAELAAADIAAGDTVIVHTSLKGVGWIAGGPQALIAAILSAIGTEGTLVMPSFSAHLTDPAFWAAPPVPADWVPVIEAEMPAFDPARTPTRDMGATAELFRTWPGVLRSNHPTNSFAAFGPKAADILGDQQLEHPMAAGSPLEKLYEFGATTLLLGIGFLRFTMLHLAEARAWPRCPREAQASPVMEEGKRVWKRYTVEHAGETGHFVPLGQSLVEDGIAREFAFGAGEGIAIPCREAVDRAVERWRKE
ncbi:aminoglycoside N(3)-acetyltransferase [Martelella endophytica]|uniref:Aminoglycoside N(3)-acetyltransferase n=1 Tax=Martelella endophytica TaxID=1486262 RepID=A0A0D5LQG9_MAREN|nr:AAC(3) family N-acetyltransferase [Martelella endophytica]AJY46361.1 aminoglycoside acetyltransferase [Martelella endophytica]